MFPNVPPAILPFIQDPPLLKGESRQEYYDLLAALIAEIAPVDTVEWLLVIDYANCIWEIRHNRRSKTFLIDLQRTKDLNMMASLPYDECAEYLANSTTDPDFFRRYGTDARSMAATAFVKVAPKLELIDKSLERSERRADQTIEKIESRRELFAHRARRAGVNIVNAQYEEQRRIESADTSIVIEPMNEMNEEQIVDGDSVSIIPSLAPESNEPDSDGSSLNPSPITSPDETQG